VGLSDTEYLVRGKERRNIIDKGKATFQESVTSTKSLFYEAATDEEKMRIRNVDIPSLIDTAVESNYLSVEEGVLWEQKINSELIEEEPRF